MGVNLLTWTPSPKKEMSFISDRSLIRDLRSKSCSRLQFTSPLILSSERTCKKKKYKKEEKLKESTDTINYGKQSEI